MLISTKASFLKERIKKLFKKILTTTKNIRNIFTLPGTLLPIQHLTIQINSGNTGTIVKSDQSYQWRHQKDIIHCRKVYMT